MATYINGITDYLPQIQPFKPDFNFYNTVLQTKEKQFEIGYQKISRLYGTLLNSPMLRDNDIKRRDDFFKQIHQEIQKLSMVDLSLEQNVNTARQVFQPLIDDKNIWSDMAYTKMYNNEKQKAESLRNCVSDGKKKCIGYWEPGVRNLEYWKDDYRSTTDEEALNRDWTPRYVPQADVTGMFTDLMNKSKFKVVNTGYSKDGRFIVEQTDGNLLTLPLVNFLSGTIGMDPAVADMYKVLAQNQRHEWVNQHAQQFNGDHGAAEDAYYNMMMSDTEKHLDSNKKTLDNTHSVLDNKLSITKKAIESSPNGVSPDSDIMKTLGLLLQEKQVATDASTQVDSALHNLKTVGMFTEDRMARRTHVDGAYGQFLMNREMFRLADSYAQGHSETKWKTNQYKLAQEKHAMAVSLSDRKFQQDLYRDELKGRQKLKEIEYKERLKGNLGPVNPSNDYNINTGAETVKGASTAQLDELGEQFTSQHKLYGQEVNFQASAVKTLFSDLANKADYGEGDEKEYARSLINQYFGKPAQGKSYSDMTATLKNPEKYYGTVKSLIKDSTFKKTFGTTVSKVDNDVRSVDLENKAILAYQGKTKRNIKSLFDYLTANKGNIKGASDEDIKMMQAVIDPNLGNTRSVKDIYETLRASNPNISMSDVEEIRNKYKDLFRYHYGQGYTKGNNQTPVVEPYEWIPGQALNVGGRAANPISSRIGATPADINVASGDAQEMYRFLKNNKSSQSYMLYKGSGVTSDEVSKGISPDGSSTTQQFLEYALNTLVNDMNTKKTSKAKLSEGSNITLHPIIANDKGKRGVSFNIPETVFNEWKKDSGLKSAKYEDYANITVVMPSSAAPYSIFNRFEPKPIKAIMQSGETVEVNYPNGGTIKLIPNSDGTVGTAGIVKWVDENGKLQQKNANTVGINPALDPDYLYWRFNAAMKELDQKNYELLTSPNNPANVGQIRTFDQAMEYINSRMQGQ